MYFDEDADLPRANDEIAQQALMVPEITDDPHAAMDEEQHAGLPLTCSGFMTYSFTLRPSWLMVCSVTVTPDMSTVVCDRNLVRILCGFGWGSSQNGLLSLLMSARTTESEDRSAGRWRRPGCRGNA